MKPGDRPPNRPTVPQVLPLVEALYASKEGGVGCCLHIVLDDGNVADDFVTYCLSYAKERQHPACIHLAELMLQMSPTQRLKLGALI